MTKDDLIRNAAIFSGYSQPVVRDILEHLIARIRAGVEVEGIVRIGGLGAFVKKVRKGRVYYGRALKGTATPPPVEYPDTSVVRFMPAARFKDMLSPPLSGYPPIETLPQVDAVIKAGAA
jgi:nucleoid DNA-binding protein